MQPDKQLNRYIHSGFGSKRTIIKSIFFDTIHVDKQHF